LERSDEPIDARRTAVSLRPGGDSLDVKLDRIEKLLETINLRLAAMGGRWKPSDEIR
jgi:hypothetical protein